MKNRLFLRVMLIFNYEYVNKQNYQFQGKENPNVSIAVSFHSEKVSAWAAISVKEIYLQFFELTVIPAKVTKSCWRVNSFLMQRNCVFVFVNIGAIIL